jgi:uncharacterized membrane protein
VPPDAGRHLDAIQRIYIWLPIVWVVGLAVVIPLAWFIRRTWVAPSRQAEDSPELILKRRYARGEIDRDEYKALLNDLRSS